MMLAMVRVPDCERYHGMLQLFGTEREARAYAKRTGEACGIECEVFSGRWADVPIYMSYGRDMPLRAR